MTNEEANRRAKAIKLAEHLAATRPAADLALFDATHADSFTWAMWARSAGVSRPSTLCQGEVISLLTVRVHPDPFKGLPQ